MDHERWKRIAEVYDSALDETPERRSAFVAEACGDDVELRQEIESLFAQDGVQTLIDRDLDVLAGPLLSDTLALEPGAMVGPYRVVGLLGAGGMGEVYRAFDTKLHRDVAIKILPDAFVDDESRLARFRREAHTLASLNHPNIAAIYGLEDSAPVHALVLELVDGPTLAERIARGPVPIEDALAVALQIAGALQAAHDHGVVHRDLKPANIKVRDDGAVKVLDFGLATSRPTAIASGSGTLPSSAPLVDTTGLPTLAQTAFSAPGIILGTAPYMAPEQAKGEAADKRCDIWAFGCVVYEMLSGRRAFPGENVSETLAAVLRGEPDWEAVPTTVPPAVTMLLKRCLERSKSRRLQDVSAALFVLGEPELFAPRVRRETRPSRWTRRATVAIGALACLAIGTAAAVLWRGNTAASSPVTRLEVPLKPGGEFSAIGRHVVAISPDGTQLAYVANSMLYLRRLDALEAVPVRGSADGQFARSPFFSPDSKWLAFWQNNKLRKVPVDGGTPVNICDALNPHGAVWESDDTILFGQGLQGIFRVPASGGTPSRLIAPSGGFSHGPQLLPGGRAVLFTFATQKDSPTWDDADIVVESLDTHERKTLVHGGTDARYLSTGHLIYSSAGTLFAVPFDAVSLTTKGAPTAVVRRVAQSGIGQTGASQLSTSATGTLAYLSGNFLDTTLPSKFVLVDRAGGETLLSAPARPYLYPHMSPDGTRIVTSIRNEPENIWIWDLRQQSPTKLTFAPGRQNFPVWTPNGERVAYGISSLALSRIFWQPANGSGTPELLMASPSEAQLPTSFSPDGTQLVFFNPNKGVLSIKRLADGHVWTIDDGPATITRNGVVSPNGRWLAYESDASGRLEVFVRSMQENSPDHWLVSSDGGTQAAWSRTGNELFYVAPKGGLMHVTFGAGATWTASQPTLLIQPGAYRWSAPAVTGRLYDTTPDGRFLLLKPDPTAAVSPEIPHSIVVVTNWFEELTRLVPTR